MVPQQKQPELNLTVQWQIDCCDGDFSIAVQWDIPVISIGTELPCFRKRLLYIACTTQGQIIPPVIQSRQHRLNRVPAGRGC